ncbi:hypothetical protein SK571_03885 [Lentzea sp. BCCO 10_0798]|uniref:Uncharacterized protein n=1 Tax=Lentzea kristufekii TaxID=3095430 RepID=A0ABU4TKX9_9PSEU|nr:hypothetical protein [Lentzea sp. BCCO 10_0798]MDX8048511.1 hypothetical protein [Lentzea sp. BCCO 10_0798]
MSTTITSEHTPTSPPLLCDVLSGWITLAPGLDASNAAVADWFEQAVRLLAPITSDLSHPQHTDAVALASEFSHDAIVLRDTKDSEAAR